MEHRHTRKGGPARHLHVKEDEWFYVLDGEYVVQVESNLWSAGPGDSVLIPRQTPHTFAFKGEGTGRLLVAFSPAGKMEASFRAFKKSQWRVLALGQPRGAGARSQFRYGIARTPSVSVIQR